MSYLFKATFLIEKNVSLGEIEAFINNLDSKVDLLQLDKQKVLESKTDALQKEN